MKISIAIQYYNRKSLLINTIKSIQQTSINKQDFEIIIVDDASVPEHSIDLIADQFPDLNIKIFSFKPEEKWWICPVIPINKGISLSSGDAIILLCAECMFMGDILLDVQNKLTLGNYFSYATLALNDHDTNLISSMSYEELLSNPFTGSWYQHSIHRNRCYNFCSAIMKSDMLELGGFDERYAYGTTHGDDDFVLRLRRKEMNIVSVDIPFTYHQNHKDMTYHVFKNKQNSKINANLVNMGLYNYIKKNEPNNIKVANSFL
jgi:glycosyltransferase involved in cell wall biosynthesis